MTGKISGDTPQDAGKDAYFAPLRPPLPLCTLQHHLPLGYALPVRVHVGSDHGGLLLRAALIEDLRSGGHEVLSVRGPKEAGDKADYPDVAHEVALAVRADEGSRGLLVCGTGQGMAMAANSVSGVRAGVVNDPFSARMLRAHNDAQILCLGERVLGVELARILLHEFLNTEFEGGRHARRVGKIDHDDAVQD